MTSHHEPEVAPACDHKFVDSNACVRPGCGVSIESLKAAAYNEALQLIAATTVEVQALVEERDQLRTELGQASVELRAKAEEVERLKDERDEAESAARQADESKLTERKERIRNGRQLAAANALLARVRMQASHMRDQAHHYRRNPDVCRTHEECAKGIELVVGTEADHLSGQPAAQSNESDEDRQEMAEGFGFGDYATMVRLLAKHGWTRLVANQPPAPDQHDAEIADLREHKVKADAFIDAMEKGGQEQLQIIAGLRAEVTRLTEALTDSQGHLKTMHHALDAAERKLAETETSRDGWERLRQQAWDMYRAEFRAREAAEQKLAEAERDKLSAEAQANDWMRSLQAAEQKLADYNVLESQKNALDRRVIEAEEGLEEFKQNFGQLTDANASVTVALNAAEARCRDLEEQLQHADNANLVALKRAESELAQLRERVASGDPKLLAAVAREMTQCEQNEMGLHVVTAADVAALKAMSDIPEDRLLATSKSIGDWAEPAQAELARRGVKP